MEALKTLRLRQLAGDLLGPRFLERDRHEASMGFQDRQSALRFEQISAKEQQNASMSCRKALSCDKRLRECKRRMRDN